MKLFRFLTLLTGILLFSHLLLAQTVQKNKGEVNGTKFNFYYLQPQGKITGLLILLPAAGEKPQHIFKRTRLPQLMAEKGYITLISEVHTLLWADDYSIKVIEQLLTAQMQKYQVSNWAIGGLSSGGAIATRYAEYVLSKGETTGLKALIVVDAPLDLERIYNSATQGINYPCGGLIVNQNKGNKAQLEHATGGTPAEHREQYIRLSGYTASADDGGNARYLKNLPVRLYSEPDLAFVQKTYCADLKLTDLNATDMQSLNLFCTKQAMRSRNTLLHRAGVFIAGTLLMLMNAPNGY